MERRCSSRSQLWVYRTPGRHQCLAEKAGRRSSHRGRRGEAAGAAAEALSDCSRWDAMAQRMSTCFVMRNLIGRADKPVVITSEGGRATLAATCDREDRIIQHLRARFGHVSVERALSGPGLENIYRAIGAVDKVATALQNAAQITKSALRGECHVAVEALNVFCAFLGSFAGNVALTFDGRGGVYIAGGISPRIVDFMRRSQFRVRFEGKGRFQQYLKPIPVHVVTHPAAAFIGLKSLLSARS